jgi:hypothetical protein
MLFERLIEMGGAFEAAALRNDIYWQIRLLQQIFGEQGPLHVEISRQVQPGHLGENAAKMGGTHQRLASQMGKRQVFGQM